jgi:Glycosyl transferase family 2
MRISLYTFVRNGLHLDFHVVPMLRHHLPLADEIIVNEGYSTDGTYEAIVNLDPKVRVVRTEWGEQRGLDWYRGFKNAARRHCAGDWCVYLDCDEFIPEWQFEPLRQHLQETSADLVALEEINFYANYRVYHRQPEKVHWPGRKMAIHRNRDDIEFWGDGSNLRLANQEFHWPERPYPFECHHFGFVRHAARLREKWLAQSVMYGQRRWRLPLPSWLFDLMPHRWDDPMFLPDLAVYSGPLIKAVRDDPDEFTRDGMKTYRTLLDRDSGETRENASPETPAQGSSLTP